MGRCIDGRGYPTNHEATGAMYSPEGRRIVRKCAACAQRVIDEYREKLGEVWTYRDEAHCPGCARSGRTETRSNHE